MTQELARTEPADLVAVEHLAADRNPALVYLAHLAPGSRRTMRPALDTLAGLLTTGRADATAMRWELLRYQHTAAARSVLAERFAPATANKHLAALRGVLREAWRLGLMPADAYQRAADLPGVRGSTLPRGRALSRGELVALFQVCAGDDSPAGARNAALLAVAYGAGLRRSELVALDLGDFDTETGALTVRSGKGRKARVAYATNGSKAALEAWLRVRSAEPGPLFQPVNKAGRIVARRLTAQTVLDIVDRLSVAAGVVHFSPHDLRRSFVSDLLDAGADVSTTQRLAGHSNVTTTVRYDRRGEEAKRRASELLTVPYSGV